MVSLNTDIPQAHASRSCGSCLKTIAVLAKPSKHSCKYYIGLLSNKCFIFIPSFMGCSLFHDLKCEVLLCYFTCNIMQLEALVHPFFDELRDPNTRLPNGRFLPPLFNFKSHGKKQSLLCCSLDYFNCLMFF